MEHGLYRKVDTKKKFVINSMVYIRRKNAAWKSVPMDAGLKHLICIRRLDFVDVQESLMPKFSIKKWKLLEARLDDLENLCNNGKRTKGT